MRSEGSAVAGSEERHVAFLKKRTTYDCHSLQLLRHAEEPHLIYYI